MFVRLTIIILSVNISLLYSYASSINYIEAHSIYLRKNLVDANLLQTRDYMEYGILFTLPRIKKYLVDIGFILKNEKNIYEMEIRDGSGSSLGWEDIIITIKSNGIILNLHSPTVIASFNPVVSYRHEIETHNSEWGNHDSHNTYYRTILSIYLKRNLGDRYFLNVGYSGIKSRVEYFNLSNLMYENPIDGQQRANFSSDTIRNIPDVITGIGDAYKYGIFELAVHYRALEKLQFGGTLGKYIGHDTGSLHYSLSMRMYF